MSREWPDYVAGSPGQTLDGGNGKTILDGTLGNQHLNRRNGADVLVGGPKDAILTGGNGPDIFVFKGSFGHNEITDFATADALQLEKSTFGTIADLLAHDIAADGHGGTVVTDPHNAANVIVLDHVNVNQLTRPRSFWCSCSALAVSQARPRWSCAWPG